jgi:hypothetical protein
LYVRRLTGCFQDLSLVITQEHLALEMLVQHSAKNALSKLNQHMASVVDYDVRWLEVDDHHRHVVLVARWLASVCDATGMSLPLQLASTYTGLCFLHWRPIVCPQTETGATTGDETGGRVMLYPATIAQPYDHRRGQRLLQPRETHDLIRSVFQRLLPAFLAHPVQFRVATVNNSAVLVQRSKTVLLHPRWPVALTR